MPYMDWNGNEIEDAEWDAIKREAKNRMANLVCADSTLEIEMIGYTMKLTWEDVKTKNMKSFSAEFFTQDEARVAHKLAVEFCKELSHERDDSKIKVWLEDRNVFAMFERTRTPILMLSATFSTTPSAFSAGHVLKTLYSVSDGYELQVANLADLLGEG